MLGDDIETGRGFKCVIFKDAYKKECSLQASSAIGDYDDSYDRPGSSFVWLGIDDADPKIMKRHAMSLGMNVPPGDTTGWMPFHIPEGVSLTTRMHLNREQVEGLIERLQCWLKCGEFEQPIGVEHE